MVLERKIAFINLSNSSIKIKSIHLDLRRKFLGGRGINMYLLSKIYSPDLDPLSPETPLIFGAGLLTGTLGFGSRINITAKSPESGHLGDSNMGGDFGAELVQTGFSHLVITGRSRKPVYLMIKNRGIEIRDAKPLSGLDTVETQQRIRQELGDEKVRVACIGLAGENLVRFASIRTGLKNSAGRTGMGAVMGSKNLKAVAVRGTLEIKIADPKNYLRYYLGQLKRLMDSKWVQALGRYGTPLLFQYANAMGFLSIRNNQLTTIGDQGYALEAEALEPYSFGMLSCFGCPAHCRHRYCLPEGRYYGTKGEGPEYASIGSLGTKLGNLDLENIIYATELCNRYGLDTISTGSYIAWAMELYQRGILDKKLTGSSLDWGDGESILQLLHHIAQRKEFGNTLAEGPFAKRVFGEGSEEYLLNVKNFPIEMTDERLPKSFALGMATSTRGACHMRSRPSLDVLGLPEDILEKIYGGSVSSQFSSYSGKGRMVWWHELLNAVSDSLGFCRFLTVFSSPHAPQYKQFSKLIALSTGLTITPKELKTIGERIYTLERMMLVRDGIFRKDDTLPRRYFEEPIPEGPAKGEVISREEFNGMLDEYYRLHGWDKNGIPRKETLRRLGLEV
ncbi:MAG: aldehyde ferredoxin oxidoreductase family protein [Deltaproteobacteria bacterium]|nr:aldehyde ferredoxin oxidoreductase family protein [Deltaproteobacteria bacterium]MBM4322674.1 aldehyde ferredoxin oxidoreductase family protein [Deltaproteobacteria bacterium]